MYTLGNKNVQIAPSQYLHVVIKCCIVSHGDIDYCQHFLV